jgi:hypothetical protein
MIYSQINHANAFEYSISEDASGQTKIGDFS